MAELTRAEVLLLKTEAALRVAMRALGPLTGSSREACVALDTIERILSDDWDGREGAAQVTEARDG